MASNTFFFFFLFLQDDCASALIDHGVEQEEEEEEGGKKKRKVRQKGRGQIVSKRQSYTPDSRTEGLHAEKPLLLYSTVLSLWGVLEES